MTKKNSIIALLAALALMGGFMAPTTRSEPERVEPLHHSPHPSAYLAYTFRLEDYIGRDAIGPSRMYYLMPADSRTKGMMLLSYRELLDHYAVRTDQLNRVPTRMPVRWIEKHRNP